MPDGSGFKKLHDITFTRNTSHGFPQNLLLDSYGYLYGKFPAASGTIFRIKTDGTDLKILYDQNVTIYNIQLVKSINPAYKLISPAHGTTNVATSHIFKADSVPCALRYSLELSPNSNFTAPTMVFNSTDPQFQVAGLTPSTKYYARVRTSLWQRPGLVTSFTTATSYSDLNSGSLSVYPNPSTATFRLHKSDEDASEMKIEITDFTGTVVDRFDFMEAETEVEFGATLPKGVYILKTFSGNTTTQKRLIKK
jgi:hypothetical protein